MPTLLALADLGEPRGDFQVSPTVFFTLFGLGFLIAALGHLAQSRTLIGAGVVLIFLGVVAVPVALYLSA
jgi:hypothetical protein